MVLRGKAAKVDLGNIICLAAMLIPRFVTWRNVTQILPFVDLSMVNW
jgi:hypothetical protein